MTPLALGAFLRSLKDTMALTRYAILARNANEFVYLD